MRLRDVGLFATFTLLFSTTAVACGGSNSDTLTYWASNQAPTLQLDAKTLKPELKKFEKKTGIKVKLQVIGWPDLLKKIMGATTSGNGPDVLNIGNTWAASLQATGAFAPFDSATMKKVGGRDQFVHSTLATMGAPGKTPASVPLYGLAYGLFYNKKMFADAHIAKPPATWTQFVTDAKKLTKNGKWGVAVEGGSYTENAHHAYIMGVQQGNSLFTRSGKPRFDTPREVRAVKQYIDFMGADKVANPSDAEYTDGTKTPADFAKGKAAMMLWQANGMANLKADGMKPGQYAVAPMPFPAHTPPGGKHINTFAAGINVSVFKNTKNKAGALKLVKFLTSTPEQKILNKAFGTLPVNKGATTDPAFNTPKLKPFQQSLAHTAGVLPEIPKESQFETTVGTAMKNMFARAADGKPITTGYVKSQLTAAQQKMSSGG